MPAIHKPATGEPLAEITAFDPAQFPAILERAREGQKMWMTLSSRERARRIKSLSPIIGEHAEALAASISDCTGKTRVDALSTEVLPAVMCTPWYARAARRLLRPEHLRGSSILFFNKRSTLHREPYGVIGIISPWNYPFGIPFQEVLMAIAGGNAIVLKVVTQAQGIGDFIERIVKASTLPADLVQVCHIPGALAGPLFIESGIDKLFFTGSTAVGKELMALAAEKLTPVSLELGGNDAMIVLDDANLVRAAGGALWAGLSNCGQSCGGVQRILVHETVKDAFMLELKRQFSSLRQGPDSDHHVDIGALSTAKQKAMVKSQIDAALRAGARIACTLDELEGPGWFQAPVILEVDDPSNPFMHEEVFGPVMSVTAFKDADEAIALANDSTMGLTTSIWTGSGKRGKQLAARLEAGAITLNDHLMSHGMCETPWGGYKESAIGRSHGRLGLEEVTQAKVVVEDQLHRLPRNMWWYPHGPHIQEGLKGAVDLLADKGLAKRLKGALKVAGLYLSRLHR